MNTTLNNLTEKVRENRLRNLAKNIIKYQNFSTNAVIRKIDNAGYSERTLRFYIDKGIAYLKNGTAYGKLGKMSNYLDDGIKECIQPLTPSEQDKRRSVVGKDKAVKTEPPVVKVLENINKKKTAFIVKFNNNALLYEGKDEAEAFKQGLYFAGIGANIVEIEYKEVL